MYALFGIAWLSAPTAARLPRQPSSQQSREQFMHSGWTCSAATAVFIHQRGWEHQSQMVFQFPIDYQSKVSVGK